MGSTATKRSKGDGAAAAPSTPSSDKRGSWKSRAVLRTVEAGSAVECVHCEEPIKFRAKIRQHQAICNIYEKGVWKRVEHYHKDCYDDLGAPYGEPAA